MSGSGYGSVDIAEILSAEVEKLRSQVGALASAFTAVWITADRGGWDPRAVEHFDALAKAHNVRAKRADTASAMPK